MIMRSSLLLSLAPSSYLEPNTIVAFVCLLNSVGQGLDMLEAQDWITMVTIQVTATTPR